MEKYTVVNNNEAIEKKMTSREFFNAVLALDNVPENVRKYAENKLQALDEANSRKSNSLTPNQRENLIHMENILNVLTNEPMIASDISEKTGLSVSKISALCRKLAGEQRIKVCDVKVKNRGVLKAYNK